MKMMMIMVIILMFDDDNAQKSSTTMTLWSKYTPFKYYYLVKKKDQTNRAGVDPLPPRDNGQHGHFFWTTKTTLNCALQNQIPIDYDDENGDNYDGYDDDNDQQHSTTMTLWSKYPPFNF